MTRVGSTLDKNSSQEKPWTAHRKNAGLVQGIYADNDFLRYAERISQCATYLEFAEVAEHDRKLKLTRAHFCRVRHCPVCSWRRALALIARFKKNLPEYLEQYPQYAYLYLVLTVRDPDMSDLRSTIQAMNHALEKMLKRKAVQAIYKGHIKTIEVTRDSSGNPHPHINLIIAVNPSYFTSHDYLSKKKWVELWKSCLGVDYDPSVFVSRVRKRKKKSAADDSQSELVQGVAEVVKYSVKESDLVTDPAFLVGITKQLFKMRFLASGGCLKHIFKNPVCPAEDEISEDEMLLKDETSESASDVRQLYLWDKKNYVLRERFRVTPQGKIPLPDS